MTMEKIIGMVKSVLTMLAPSLKNEASVHGVKEFRELLKGCLAVALILVKKFKDGVQFSDFTEFYTAITSDGDFKKTLEEAYDGYNKVPEELKDIDAGEGLEVACDVIDFVPEFAKALKKEEKAIEIE